MSSHSFRSLLDGICREFQLPFVDLCAGNDLSDVLHYQWTGGSTNRGKDTSTGTSRSWGLEEPDSDDEVSGRLPVADRRYLVASITKPVVGMAAVQLVAEGRLGLNQRVADILPECDRAQVRNITVRHLLTHSSGWPDMLPENEQLRIDHAPLSEFVRRACETNPEFPPGSNMQYSSMGFGVLGAVIERLTGEPLGPYLRFRYFEPLGMMDSWLGLPEDEADDLLPTVLPSVLPNWQTEVTDWNWNSRYWRTIGAPWGGLITTASDLGALARSMLSEGGNADNDRIYSALAVEAATRNQTDSMPMLSESARRQPWGLGWRMNWQTHSSCFCELLPESAFGHWGATGTAIWIDHASGQFTVILTTVPFENSGPAIQRLSNLVAARMADQADL